MNARTRKTAGTPTQTPTQPRTRHHRPADSRPAAAPRPHSTGFARRRCRRGSGAFTLVEIMVATLIMMVLLSIAVPNFASAKTVSRTKTCLRNLREIESAKTQWAMETRAAPTDTPVWSELIGISAYLRTAPACQAGGTYTIGPIIADATCSVGGGHAL